MPLTFQFAPDPGVPNSDLPLLVYQGAFPADAATIERRFAANDWRPAWRSGVHPFHHFHANTHEALGVASGWATVLFGGPAGQTLTVKAGDVVVIPAGVGHCNIEQSPDLVIVGAYPTNAPTPDMYRDARGSDHPLDRLIATVPPPPADPVEGTGGALSRLWA